MPDLATLTVEVVDKGITIAATELRKLTTESNNAEKSVGKLAKTNKVLEKSNKRTAKSFLDMSSAFKVAGRDISRYVTLPLLAAGAASFKFGSDLNEGLGLVESLLPGTVTRIDELKEAVKETAVVAGQGFNDLTEGMYQTISAFQDSEDTIGRFNTVSKAAVAGNASVKSSLELLSAVTKGYDDTTTEAVQKVSDLSFEAIRLGQTTFPELAASIQKVTSLSSTLAISQEELFTVFATLTGVTGDAAEVSTQYKSILASLMNPTATLTKLFKRMGVESGKQAIEQIGFGNTIKFIVDTAKKSDIPLQKFIRRINGIVGAEALAGAQSDDFVNKLEEISDAADATDKAFKAVTEGVNSYGFQLKQAKARLAVVSSEVYDTFIPAFTEAITVISNAFSSFTNMDVVLKNVVISLIAFAAAVGPALIAFGGLLRIIKLVTSSMGLLGASALPITIALAAITAGIALLGLKAGLAAKKQEEFRESLAGLVSDGDARVNILKDMTNEFKNLTDSEGINLALNEQLIQRFPALTDIIDTATTKVTDLRFAFDKLNAKAALDKSTDTYKDQIKEADKVFDRLLVIQQEAERAQSVLGGTEFTIAENLSRGEDITFLEQQLADLNIQLSEADKNTEFFDTQLQGVIDSINSTALNTGIEAFRDGFTVAFRSIYDEASETGKKVKEGLEGIELSDDDASNGLKTWEEWFDDVTGVSIKRFSQLESVFDEKGRETIEAIRGSGSGKKAGEAFIADLQAGLDDKIELSRIFGETTDIEKGLEGIVKAGESSILELLSIRAELIAGGEDFKLTDNAIKAITKSLIAEKDALVGVQNTNFFADVKDQIRVMDEFNVAIGEPTDSMEAMGEKLDVLHAAYKKLVEDQGAASDAAVILKTNLDETTEAYKALADTRLVQATEDLKDFTKELTDNLFKALIKLPELADTAALSLAKVTISLLNLGISAVASGLEDLGKALSDGAISGEEFSDILVKQAAAILDMLPMLFLQAGLNLIASGQIPLGLGFVAAGLSSAILNGLTKGAIANEQEASANATGNAFDGGNILPFAKGGSFTNSVVSSPTFFPFANGTGVMGEAGPEAIMPLTRGSDGNLGVRASGGGSETNVSITIINNSGEDVSTTENQTSEGLEIEVMVGKIVDKQLAGGKFDKSMNARYKTKPAGITA